MEKDLISLFLIRKKQNISKYSQIILKYTLKNKVNLEKTVNKIIDIYYNNYYLEKNTDYTILTKYFEIDETKESLMKDVLLSAILFYKNNGLEDQIKSEIKTIVVLSNTIYLSTSLDNKINEYQNSVLEIEDRFDLFKKEYLTRVRITEEQLYDLCDELFAQIKKDVNAEKKFWKSLLDSNYILDFKKTNEYDNYYIVNYHYDIKLLNRYDKLEVEKTSQTKGIMDEILTIYLEKLSIFILKNLLSQNFDDYFYINIYCDYFNKNKNLVNLDRILTNESIKKRIVFLFDIKDVEKNKNVIKYLNSKCYMVAVNKIDSEANLDTTTFDMFDYVFISNQILNRHTDLREIWNIKNVKFIIDENHYIDVCDDDIINRW